MGVRKFQLRLGLKNVTFQDILISWFSDGIAEGINTCNEKVFQNDEILGFSSSDSLPKRMYIRISTEIASGHSVVN